MEKANSCLLKIGNVCTGYRMGFIHVRIGFLAPFLDYLLLVVADVSIIAKSTPDPSIPLNGTAVQSLIYRFDIIQFALEMHHSLPFFSNYRSNLDHNRSFSETCISHTNPTIEEKKNKHTKLRTSAVFSSSNSQSIITSIQIKTIPVQSG